MPNGAYAAAEGDESARPQREAAKGAFPATCSREEWRNHSEDSDARWGQRRRAALSELWEGLDPHLRVCPNM